MGQFEFERAGHGRERIIEAVDPLTQIVLRDVMRKQAVGFGSGLEGDGSLEVTLFYQRNTEPAEVRPDIQDDAFPRFVKITFLAQEGDGLVNGVNFKAPLHVKVFTVKPVLAADR